MEVSIRFSVETLSSRPRGDCGLRNSNEVAKVRQSWRDRLNGCFRVGVRRLRGNVKNYGKKTLGLTRRLVILLQGV